MLLLNLFLHFFQFLMAFFDVLLKLLLLTLTSGLSLQLLLELGKFSMDELFPRLQLLQRLLQTAQLHFQACFAPSCGLSLQFFFILQLLILLLLWLLFLLLSSLRRRLLLFGHLLLLFIFDFFFVGGLFLVPLLLLSLDLLFLLLLLTVVIITFLCFTFILLNLLHGLIQMLTCSIDGFLEIVNLLLG